ncbi:hypothetical protein Pla110_17720 [Polystyrenella longa]|uniref:Uncharacterized protein n=1 Tax=Polystyrenella longa TaxID=2528007 RepID=A0A518CLE2_9PLAN|nr:hypothetical protein Pla110_17720 [Polystyrenella longa]
MDNDFAFNADTQDVFVLYPALLEYTRIREPIDILAPRIQQNSHS